MLVGWRYPLQRSNSLDAQVIKGLVPLATDEPIKQHRKPRSIASFGKIRHGGQGSLVGGKAMTAGAEKPETIRPQARHTLGKFDHSASGLHIAKMDGKIGQGIAARTVTQGTEAQTHHEMQ